MAHTIKPLRNRPFTRLAVELLEARVALGDTLGVFLWSLGGAGFSWRDDAGLSALGAAAPRGAGGQDHAAASDNLERWEVQWPLTPEAPALVETPQVVQTTSVEYRDAPHTVNANWTDRAVLHDVFAAQPERAVPRSLSPAAPDAAALPAVFDVAIPIPSSATVTDATPSYPLALSALVAQEIDAATSAAGVLTRVVQQHGGATPKKGPSDGPGVLHDNDASVVLWIPFEGYWDRFALAHPSVHHTPWGGDWSLDYYNVPGTATYFAVIDWYYGGNAFGQVEFVRATCASGVIADGGWSVKVVVYSSQGDRLGWVLYAHLTQPAVSAGQWISPWTYLGNTARWNYSTCYQVTTDAGVHTHVEVYNYTHYACYFNHGSRSYLQWHNGYLGMIGGHGAFAARRECWT